MYYGSKMFITRVSAHNISLHLMGVETRCVFREECLRLVTHSLFEITWEFQCIKVKPASSSPKLHVCLHVLIVFEQLSGGWCIITC